MAVESTVIHDGVAIASRLLAVARARKHASDGTWRLVTRGGSLIAVFDNEHQLEEWWKSFQQAQGRVPKELAAGPAPKRGPRNKNKLKTKYLSRPIESPDPGKEPDQHGHWW